MKRSAASHPILLLALAGQLCLPACDDGEVALDDLEEPDDLDELDVPHVDITAFDAFAPVDTSVRDGFDEVDGLQGPDPDNQTVSCDLGLPALVQAGPGNSATATGYLSGVASALYFFDAVRPNFPWLSYWSIDANHTTVAGLNQPSPLFFGADGTQIDVFLQAPAGAVPGATYQLQVRLYTSAGQLACTDNVTLKIPATCGPVGWWYQNPWPTPGYDGANCFVTGLPAGAQSFVWSNNWYVVPGAGNSCSIGSFDGANCYIGSAPGGSTAFFWNNSVYFSSP